MKTLFKILRSITTSLLFITLIITITIELLLTSIFITDNHLANLIEPEEILSTLIDDDTITPIKEISLEYTKDYISYVLYKKSYPSIQTYDLSSLEEIDQTACLITLNEIKNKIDLNYEDILMIREISSFATNGSIFLLINIGVIVEYLIISIISMNFKTSSTLLGISLIASTSIITILQSKFFSIIEQIPKKTLQAILTSILSNLKPSLTKLSTIYFAIGLVLLLIVFLPIITRRLFKKNN